MWMWRSVPQCSTYSVALPSAPQCPANGVDIEECPIVPNLQSALTRVSHGAQLTEWTYGVPHNASYSVDSTSPWAAAEWTSYAEVEKNILTRWRRPWCVFIFVLCYSFEVYFTFQNSSCFKFTIQRFTKLCKHYHNLIWEYFHYPKRNLVFLCLLLSPGNHQSIYCLYGSASGDTSYKGIIELMAFHIWKLLRSRFEVCPCWSTRWSSIVFTAQ